MRLLLIRHGQTPSNVLGTLDTGIPGPGLTPLGEAQARAVPDALLDEKVAGVYVSRMVRTHLTARPLVEARGLEVRERPGLEEISAGAFEMRSDDDAVLGYAECLTAWMHGDLSRPMPGGHDGHAFMARYDEAVRAIAREHDAADTVALVSHGAAIRMYTAVAAGIDPKTSMDLRIMNTGMAILEGHPDDGWRLTGWHSEPLGGLGLEDPAAHDVTGESTEEAIEEADPTR